VAIASRIGESVARAAMEPLVGYINTLRAGLFKQHVIPTEWQDLAEYEQPLNSEYDLVVPVFAIVEPPAGSFMHALSAPIEWTSDPLDGQEYVRGWFLYDPALDLVVFTLLYGADQPYVRDGPFWIEADLSTFFTVLS